MLLIKNAYLLSMEDVNYEVCDILVDEGKIVKVGKISKKIVLMHLILMLKKDMLLQGLLILIAMLV